MTSLITNPHLLPKSAPSLTYFFTHSSIIFADWNRKTNTRIDSIKRYIFIIFLIPISGIIYFLPVQNCTAINMEEPIWDTPFLLKIINFSPPLEKLTRLLILSGRTKSKDCQLELFSAGKSPIFLFRMSRTMSSISMLPNFCYKERYSKN